MLKHALCFSVNISAMLNLHVKTNAVVGHFDTFRVTLNYFVDVVSRAQPLPQHLGRTRYGVIYNNSDSQYKNIGLCQHCLDWYFHDM